MDGGQPRPAADAVPDPQDPVPRPGPSRPGRALDVWARSVVGWHIAFWLLIGIAVLATLDLAPGRRAVALGLLAVLGVAYLVTAQVQAPWFGGRTTAYLLLAVVVTGLLCAVDPGLSLVLYVIYAQVWLFSESLRRGALLTVAVSVSALAGFVTHHGWSWGALSATAPAMLVSLLFSLLLGFWISRIIDQSRDRAALIAELEATRSELAAADHARGVMAERERVAREIHDTLAQGFTSIVMLAQAASAQVTRRPEQAVSRLRTIEDVARENLAEARALVAAFTPVDLENTPLTAAVRRLAERFGRETGVSVEVEDGLLEGAPLNRDQEVVVLRAVQEALTNVRRHAAARHVTVRLTADAQGARLEVGDDGVGFSPETADGGYGLAGMRSRVADVGGEVDVASAPGLGTRVTVRLPAATGIA